MRWSYRSKPEGGTFPQIHLRTKPFLFYAAVKFGHRSLHLIVQRRHSGFYRFFSKGDIHEMAKRDAPTGMTLYGQQKRKEPQRLTRCRCGEGFFGSKCPSCGRGG